MTTHALQDLMSRPTEGATLEVRKLAVSEFALYRSFLIGLDPETRRQRFHGGVSDEFIRRHCASTLADGFHVHGAFLDDVLVGVSELHIAWESHEAEAAFAVDPAMRGRGIGSALMEAEILSAQNRGCTSIRVICLRDNYAMRRVAQKAEAKFLIELDELAGEIHPHASTLWSRLQEMFTDSALGHWWARLRGRSLHV